MIELSAQPGAMVGVVKDERVATPWWRSLWLRHRWLQLNLITAFIAAGVICLPLLLFLSYARAQPVTT